MAGSRRRSKLAMVLLALSFLAMSGPVHAATFTVTNTLDSGPGSLRAAITSANAMPSVANTINFTVSGTITLLSSLPIVNSSPGSLTIDGSGQAITVSGNNANLIFDVPPTSATLNLKFLTLANGNSTGLLSENGEGGAIYNNDSTVTVTDTTFSGNQAIGGAGGGNGEGGAIFNNGGTLIVTNSTFTGNRATGVLGTNSGDGKGGGIFNDEGTVTITNSTFSANQAAGGGIDGFGAGGAIFNFAGTVTITNSTLSGNQTSAVAGSFGGAIGNETGTVKLKGTILAASAPGNCGSSAVDDVGYNISDDDSCDFGSMSKNSNTMLNLGTLLNNGGPTKTIALGSGSSAIGFDTNCTDQQATPQPVRTDQRLFIRPDSPSFCDSGAYEHDGVPPIVLDTSSEKVQIARSSSPDSDEVNMAFTFTDNGDGTCNAGNDALNGVTVGLLQGTCADLPTLGLDLNLAPIVVHTIGDQSYGTFFGDLSPSGTVSARIVQLGLVDDAPCGRWTLNIEVAGISSATYGLTGGSGLGTTYALTIQDEDGNEGCFDIDNAIVGNQNDPPSPEVRRGVRR